MGLDITLRTEEPIKVQSTGIYVREGGKNKELSLTEAKERYPDKDIKVQIYETNELYSDNITHNLTTMASVAGLYDVLWRPHRLCEGWGDIAIECYDSNIEDEFEREQVIEAVELIHSLSKGLEFLINNKEKLEKLNPTNGWGSYETLLKFTSNYLKACVDYPDAKVEVYR